MPSKFDARVALLEATRRQVQRKAGDWVIAPPTDEELETLLMRLPRTPSGASRARVDEMTDDELIEILIPDLEALRRERT
jgi:hypothetical protein